MDLGLRGRVALVTGSSQGIGRATAIVLATEGTHVAVTYRRNKELAERVASDVRASGVEALALPLDLGNERSIRDAVEAVVERWGRLDVLVNNAVEWAPARAGGALPFEEVEFGEVRSQVRANVEGTIATTQAAVAVMRRRRWGRIVSVSSGLAVHGMPGSAIYSASKAALHGLTRSLSAELAPDGILTNVVMAGLTLTDHARAVVAPKVLQEVAESSPLRRIPEPEEVARTIVFLASAANTSVNGEIVLSSGGHS
jgi:3-oxoacyl-[acyl-carrier protein] reductase